ncbi:MAG: hypothetical protein QNJ14_07710 [Woeseiaceae bacterium]|nr:hypothetical protein [Woeseiaceae bacterium]
MTEDPNNPEVARAYRDLATETTPAALDNKVLNLAAREARSRYGIARAWVRPVAWAATIGLSLAIVLEVTEVIPPAADQMPTEAVIMPASEPAPAAKSEAPLERESADEAPARLQQSTNLREDVPAVGASGSANVAANPGGGAAVEMQRRLREERTKQAAPADLAEPKESPAAEFDDTDAFVATDMQILEEVEVQARQHTGDSGIAPFAVVATETADGHCDETARASGETWYECIEELRKADETEMADAELAALLLAFPDFEVPDQSR